MSYVGDDLNAFFRDDVQDTAVPQAWSDTTFFQYLDDAQRMFCRLTNGIEDSRTALDLKGVALCQLNVVPTVEWYPISPLILKIRTIYRTDTGLPVQTTFPEQLEALNIRFDGNSNCVNAVIQGMTKGFVRIWPIPNETVTLNLQVSRLPLITLTGDNSNLSPEIDDQHALALLLWCKSRAYGKQDQDTYDKTKSAAYKDLFYAYCAAAKDEQIKARHTPGNIAYGGIPIGVSHNIPRYNNDYFNRW